MQVTIGSKGTTTGFSSALSFPELPLQLRPRLQQLSRLCRRLRLHLRELRKSTSTSSMSSGESSSLTTSSTFSGGLQLILYTPS